MKIWDALVHLQPVFKGGSSTGPWRASHVFFKPNAECTGSKPGIVTMSPAWFEQAHDVSKAGPMILCQLILNVLQGTRL